VWHFVTRCSCFYNCKHWTVWTYELIRHHYILTSQPAVQHKTKFAVVCYVVIRNMHHCLVEKRRILLTAKQHFVDLTKTVHHCCQRIKHWGQAGRHSSFTPVSLVVDFVLRQIVLQTPRHRTRWVHCQLATWIKSSLFSV